MRERRGTWALLVSIAVHAIVLLFLRPAPEQPKPPRESVKLSFFKIEKPIEKPIERPTVRAERKPPPPPPLKPVSEPAPARPPESDRPTADKPTASGGALKLPTFLPSTTHEDTPAVGAKEPATHDRAKATLDGMLAEHARAANAKRKGIDARSQQIARGIQNAFEANVWAVKQVSRPWKPNAGNAVGDALGAVASQVVRDLKDGADQWQRDIAARDHPDQSLPKAGSIGPSAAGVDIPDDTRSTANPRRARSDVGLFCFGSCGSTASHEKLRLTTRIAIDHDPHGVPMKWTIEQSSGQSVFDEDALKSVELALGCMRGGTHHVLFCRGLEQPTFGPVPQHSTWLLHGIVRRWSHTERLLDPQFKPSGRRIGEGMFAGEYLESAVELVELAYWDAGSQPTSVPN